MPHRTVPHRCCTVPSDLVIFSLILRLRQEDREGERDGRKKKIYPKIRKKKTPRKVEATKEGLTVDGELLLDLDRGGAGVGRRRCEQQLRIGR